jgi:hypothetical protein
VVQVSAEAEDQGGAGPAVVEKGPDPNRERGRVGRALEGLRDPLGLVVGEHAAIVGE